MASQVDAQGQHLATVASDSHRNVDLELNSQPHMPQGPEGPVELLRRDGSSEPPANSPDQTTVLSPSPVVAPR